MKGSDEDFEMILAANKILKDENNALKEKIKQLAEYDEKTNRFYKYAKKSDNPSKAPCPKCRKKDPNSPVGLAICFSLRPLIHSIDGKYHGVYCWFHGEVWFDEPKED